MKTGMSMRAMWATVLLTAGLGMGCDGRVTKLVPEGGAPSDADTGLDSAGAPGEDTQADAVSLDGYAWPVLPLDSGWTDLGLFARDAVASGEVAASDVGQDSPPVSGADAALDVGRDSPLIAGADGSSSLGMDVLGEAAGPDCPSGTPYVVLLGGFGAGDLYRFHPDKGILARVATVSCGRTAIELNSLTASTLGPIYVSNLAGELCVVDPSTFAISSTRYDAAAGANIPYGMALLPESVPAGQVLYLAFRGAGQPDTLARVDLPTFEKTLVGPLGRRPDASIEPYTDVELTGGSRGQLYGFAATAMPPVLLTIDPGSGNATVMAEVPVGRPGGFALVEWQGTLYLFFAEAGSRRSTVYTHRPGDVHVSRVGSIDVAVIGAGVAVCP